MPDLDSALEEVRRFGAAPPVEASPVERVVERAAQRRRRRRTGAGVLASALIVLGGMAAAASLGDDPGEDVRIADEPEVVTTTPTTDGSTSTTVVDQPTGMVVEPDTDLVDGQVVRVTGPFGPGPRIQGIAICDADGLDTSDPTASCDINVERNQVVSDTGLTLSHIELTVIRRIQTGNGLVDCAERPGRCVVGVRTAAGTSYSAPISFRAGLPPAPVPAISVDPATTVGGQDVSVALAGFEPPLDPPSRDDEIRVVQCLGSPTDDWAGFATVDRCDLARATMVVPNSDGEARTTFAAYAEILTYDGWQPCDPCVVIASAWRQPLAVAAIEVAPSGSQLRPTVRIVPSGPYEPGQRVRLEGSGFGLGNGSIEIGWCPFRTDDPASEVQGDPNYGYTPCSYPIEGFDVTAGPDGTFVVEDYPLPDTDVRGFDCLDPSVRCGLAWHPGEGTPPAFVTPFDLRPR